MLDKETWNEDSAPSAKYPPATESLVEDRGMKFPLDTLMVSSVLAAKLPMALAEPVAPIRIAAAAPRVAAGWPRVTIVIPAKNEARNLPYVLARIPKDTFEVILVDGHSTDDTIAVAMAAFPRIRVLHDTRRGKGNALTCGFAAARGDIIVMLDADGSADAAEIPRFVQALTSGADIAKGSRFLKGGGSSDITRIRRVGNWGLTTLVNVLFGTNYSDLCYGYNAFWAHCLPVLSVDCDGFEVETLINVRVAKAGLRVVEVPSFEADRLNGVSNLRAGRDGRRVLKTIVRERLSWRRAPQAQPAYAGTVHGSVSEVQVRAESATNM